MANTLFSIDEHDRGDGLAHEYIHAPSGYCRFCPTRLNDVNYQLDHSIPRSRGGLVVKPSCAGCNHTKSDLTEAEFIERRVRHLHRNLKYRLVPALSAARVVAENDNEQSTIPRAAYAAAIRDCHKAISDTLDQDFREDLRTLVWLCRFTISCLSIRNMGFVGSHLPLTRIAENNIPDKWYMYWSCALLAETITEDRIRCHAYHSLCENLCPESSDEIELEANPEWQEAEIAHAISDTSDELKAWREHRVEKAISMSQRAVDWAKVDDIVTFLDWTKRGCPIEELSPGPGCRLKLRNG